MISGVLVGKEYLTPFFRTMPDKVKAELRAAVENLSLKLMRKVKDEKLSGQILKNRTGMLRRSINYKVTSTPESVTGTVGTNKEYAAAHEYGFSGVVTVKEHLRMATTAWGQKMKNPHQVTVKAHDARRNLPERSFLRSSLNEMSGTIRADIEKALAKAIKT